MEQFSVITRWFALALLIGATVLYIYQFAMRRPVLGWWARFATGAGFVMLTIAIGARSVALDGTELTGPHNTIVLLAWALVLLYFIVEHFIKVRTYGAILVPAAVALLLVAQFLSGATPKGVTPVEYKLLDSWRVGIHVALMLFGNAGFAIGSAASVLYLIQDAQLKAHKTTPLLKRLPPLGQTQMLARRVIAMTYPAYTAGMTLGVIRAIETDVSGWYADPRVMLSGIVWSTYGIYLVRVYRHGISARAASWIAIFGIVVVTVLAVLARTLPVGFHVFAL